MTREQAREKLSAYLDGELPPPEHEEIRALVESDPVLARELDELRALSAGIGRDLSPPSVSEDEWEQVALRLISVQGERFGWTLLVPGVLSLFVGGAAAFFLSNTIPIWIRASSGAAVAGLTFLLLAALADRLRARRVERYDRVER
jgi:anti-sigma factor RsiW